MVGKVEVCDECYQKCLLIHRKNPDHSPVVSSFFKVMYGKQYSKMLVVPPKFARTLNLQMGRKTCLEDSNGEKWNVVLSTVDGYPAFQEGWYKFSVDHDIQPGDFVVFHYIMESHFVVQIYGKTGCEKLTSSRKKSYNNKRHKTIRDHVSGVASRPVTEAFNRQDDVNNANNSYVEPVNVSIPENNIQNESPKVASATDFGVDPCSMIDRDASFGRQHDKDYKLDLSVFEMPAKNMIAVETDLPNFEMPSKNTIADKTSTPQLRGNVNTELSDTFLKVEPAGKISIKAEKSHIAEGNTSSVTKYQEASLSKKEYTSPPSIIPKVDMPLGSKMLQEPIELPHISEFSPTSGYCLGHGTVKQEPKEFVQDSGGNSVIGTSFGYPLQHANLSMAKISSGELCETPILNVKDHGEVAMIVKPEPVDFSDLSPTPIVKCLIPPGNEPFLELSERLPVRPYKQGTRLEKLVLLQDPARRLWPVVYHQRFGYKALASGWKAFREANNIQEGDECAFVVENVDEGIFAVQVLRS